MTTPIAVESAVDQQKSKFEQIWKRPIYSPEHGVYVVLFVSFLTGAAAAQHWTWTTTLALICAFFGFQAEHPLVLQIRQRTSLKPRFLFWGGLYGAIASITAVYLYLRAPMVGWIYLAAILALIVDAIAVFYRQQKSILNEGLTFAAVCLSAPFAYAATTGTLSLLVMGVWVVNGLYFASSIFAVKLRKLKTMSVAPGVVYHLLAAMLIGSLYYLAVIPLLSLLAWAIAPFKFFLVAWQRQWYSTAPIKQVAAIETVSAALFATLAAISLLPVHLLE
jgi:hypothetical protein